jgi:hypothetical protein
MTPGQRVGIAALIVFVCLVLIFADAWYKSRDR